MLSLDLSLSFWLVCARGLELGAWLLGIAFICFGLIVGLVGLRRGRFFSPVTLYLFSHSLAMGFSQFPLYSYKVVFSMPFLLCLVLLHGAFLFGAWFGARIGYGRDANADAVNCLQVREPWLWCLWAVAVLLFVLLSFYRGGFPMLSENPGKARLAFADGRVAGVIMALAVAAGYLQIQSAILKFRWTSLAAGLLCCVLVALSGSRAYLVMICVGAAAHLEVKWKKAGLNIVLIGAVVAVVFLAVGYFRYGNPEEFSDLSVGIQLYYILQGVYLYLVNGYWNFYVGFEQYLAGDVPWSWGLASFSGILYWFVDSYGISIAMGRDTLFNESIMMVPGLNSVTYAWNLIRDFGLVGCVCLTAVMGAVLQWIYLRFRSGGGLRFLYPFLAHQVLLSFNTFWPAEGFMSFIFLVFALFMIYGVEESAGVKKI